MRRIAFLSLAVALVGLVATTTARADQWSKTYSVSGAPHLALAADNASLNVTPGPGNQVSVNVSTTGWRIPDDVHVIQSQSGNNIHVEVKQTKHWNLFDFSHGTVSVDVSVPARSDLDLSTGNGRISLENISGNLSLHTGNGAIYATGLHGNLAFATGNGAVRASGLDGSLKAHSGNGSVNVSGRFDALQVESGRGSVDAAVLPGSKMTSAWEVQSGVGSVTLRLPANFSANLDGSTGVGRIRVDFPITTTGSLIGSSVHGRIGNGGPTLHVHTGVGSVRIERAEA